MAKNQNSNKTQKYWNMNAKRMSILIRLLHRNVMSYNVYFATYYKYIPYDSYYLSTGDFLSHTVSRDTLFTIIRSRSPCNTPRSSHYCRVWYPQHTIWLFHSSLWKVAFLTFSCRDVFVLPSPLYVVKICNICFFYDLYVLYVFITNTCMNKIRTRRGEWSSHLLSKKYNLPTLLFIECFVRRP